MSNVYSGFRLKNLISADYIKSELSSGGVGFIFHSTDWQTLSFSFDNIAPRSLDFERELWNTPPFIASVIYMYEKIIGVNLAMPVPIELWIGQSKGIKEFREKQFFPALELANKCGIDMVALGASTPYVCNYGKLPRPLAKPYITTGHAATAATLVKWAIHASDKTNCDYKKIKLAIFGAAGRLGKAVSQFISHSFPPSELILIDLSDKISLLKNQAEELLNLNSRRGLKVSIYCFETASAMPKFDGAILVSNNSVPYLTADDLRKAKFWIDDSHPRAASVEAELLSRNDTLYVECYARGPEGLSTNFPFRLPSMRDCYTCFAEGYVAWKEKIDHDFITGIPDVQRIALVSELLDKHGFGLGPFSGKNGDMIKHIL